MKRILSFLLIALCSTITSFAKEEKLTSTIKWELTPDGTLYIRGTGAMPDFEEYKPKYWRQKKYDGLIKTISIGEGITGIGAYNFCSAWSKHGNEMQSVKKIIIPSTVTSIGAGAFNFTGVEDLVIGENVKEIGAFAFSSSSMLKHVVLPKSVKLIGVKAFAFSRILESVDFSDADVTISDAAFKDDNSLTTLKNASNIKYNTNSGGKTVDFSTVFADTKLTENSDSKPLAPPVAESRGAFPDKKWGRDYRDGGMVYGYSELNLHFNDPDPILTIYGLSAPEGYETFFGEGGDATLRIFKNSHTEGNKAFFSCDEYDIDYDPATDKEIAKQTGVTLTGSAIYNPADASLDWKYDNQGWAEVIHYMNPDREQYVVVLSGHDVNIRKTPVNGVVIGKAEKGQVFKKIGEKEIKSQNEVQTWYEIALPDGSIGFISSNFANPAYDEDNIDPTKFEDSPFDPNQRFIEPIPDAEEQTVGTREFQFIKIGNRVLMVADEIYFNGRIHGCYYALGHIEGNSIVFNKGIYDQGGFAGADEAFENKDYQKLESLMIPQDQFRIYYVNPDKLYYYGEELEPVTVE